MAKSKRVVIEVGDMIVYANNHRDLVQGLPKINGRPGLLVQPLDSQIMLASDQFKDLEWVQKFVEVGVFNIVKGMPGVNPITGELNSEHIKLSIFEMARVEASALLDAAKGKHGTEDLKMFRDEWELERRLGSIVGTLRRQVSGL